MHCQHEPPRTPPRRGTGRYVSLPPWEGLGGRSDRFGKKCAPDMLVNSPASDPNSDGELDKLAFIALGSNLSDPKQNVLNAMNRLRDLTDRPLLRSSLWQSTPVDCPPGSPLFINAVVGLLPRAGTTPEDLLDQLQSIEREFGRRPKTVQNEPRPLDLDLIAFRGEIRASARLTLPHPRACQRRFVLQPLSEIAAELILPGQRLNVWQLLERLDSSERVRRLD